METHFCRVSIKVHTVQEAAVDKICSKVAIRTYAGLFQDPCKLEGYIAIVLMQYIAHNNLILFY